MPVGKKEEEKEDPVNRAKDRIASTNLNQSQHSHSTVTSTASATVAVTEVDRPQSIGSQAKHQSASKQPDKLIMDASGAHGARGMA